MNSRDQCPVCGEGVLYKGQVDDVLSYKGQEVPIKDFYSVCNLCGAKVTTPLEMRQNRSEVIRAYKKVVSLLNRGYTHDR